MLRGFDSYKVTLGDEMRGERASLGKSLAESERDLRIKSRIIEAIENCDLSGFPNHIIIPGYVRSYARYLGMNPGTTFKRFCEESGYVSPSPLRRDAAADPGSKTRRGAVGRRRIGATGAGDPIGNSRFSTPTATRGLLPRIPVGALASVAVLLALIGGLGYGGYALLQKVQRVGFEPLPDAPSIFADAPVISSPEIDTAPAPAAHEYADGGALTEVVIPPVPSDPDRPIRDGPISVINPIRAGVFPVQGRAAAAAAQTAVQTPTPAADDEGPRAPPDTDIADRGAADDAPAADAVVLFAAEDSWVRVHDGAGMVFYEGILGVGESYDLPQRLAQPLLRAGNAGHTFVIVNGVAYGPIGEPGRVVSGVSLKAQDVRALIPQAERDPMQPADADWPELRTEATQIGETRIGARR